MKVTWKDAGAKPAEAEHLDHQRIRREERLEKIRARHGERHKFQMKIGVRPPTHEYASKLEKATEELEVKTKEIQGLEKGAYEHDSKFRKAAKAACDALSEYTKENSEEAFRKTMKDFVTSAPAGM